VGDLGALLDAILFETLAQNPVVLATGKRIKPKQSMATHLIGQVRDYSDDVWPFMIQLNMSVD
jgi:transposase